MNVAVETLQALGLGLHEARVYIHLLQQPLATGYEIAKSTGIPRANVYSVLESLTTQEIVQAGGTAPARFVAAPPEQVLGRIRRRTERLCADASRELALLRTSVDEDVFWTVRGRQRILDQAATMLDSASERVLISAWSEDLAVLTQALRAARDRGATVIVNAFGDYDPGFGQVFLHEDASKAVNGRLLTLAVDFSAALTCSLDEPAAGIHTVHPGLIQLVEKLVRDESYIAELFARFREPLEQAYGPHLVDLRTRLLPEPLGRRLRDVIGPPPRRTED